MEDQLEAPALSNALRLSAVYDLVGAVLIVWMPAWLLDAFSHPLPAEPFLFRLSALPLFLMPVIYLMAAAAPIAQPHMTRASFRVRVLGGLAILLLVFWQQPAVATPYVLFGVGDLLWAVIYWALAARSGLRLISD